MFEKLLKNLPNRSVLKEVKSKVDFLFVKERYIIAFQGQKDKDFRTWENSLIPV